VASLPATLFGRIPGRMQGWIDFTRPGIRRLVGTPLNGQRGRVALVADLVRCLQPTLIAETGTNRGDTSIHLAQYGVPVHTVEVHERTFGFAELRLRGHRITVVQGDSRPFLQNLARLEPHARPLIYLDAHWYDDLPLAEELEIIARGWKDWVVLIDDFRVEGDDGYGYYDYPPGVGLSLEYLKQTGVDPADVFFPSLRSEDEDGAKRGSSIVVSPTMRDAVASLPSVRAAV
jgi:hypothetical protein